MELPSTKTVVSTLASLAATAMLVRSVAKDLIPHELSQYFFSKFHDFCATFTNEVTLTIHEFDGFARNQLFYAAEMYLSTIISPSTKRFTASIPGKEKKIHVSVGRNEDVVDKFRGFELKWIIVHRKTESRSAHFHEDNFSSSMKVEVKYLVLTFHKKHKDKVFNEYLPYVVEKSKVATQEKKTLKLHTLKSDRFHHYPEKTPWQEVNLDHPATFETLAMDDEIKKMIIDDLDRFVKRKDFYRKVGKAWKRGYLLFGPPGTGKSSLIAAMANYLNFDIYDLELTDLTRNSELRKLLLWTANKSILVVEDIDASIDLTERKTKRHQPMYPHEESGEPKVTLSGLLNFTDGLWSSCGDERIIVFTTNHIDKLDPALLRPGRMDLQIHMSYCTPQGFKMLVSNYLGNVDHPLLLEAEELIAATNVTPAEVAEYLLKSDDPEWALRGLIEFLEHKEDSKVTVEAVERVEEKEDEREMLKNVESKISPADKLLKNNEAVEALKVLIGILKTENVNKDIKDYEEVSKPEDAEISDEIRVE